MKGRGGKIILRIVQKNIPLEILRSFFFRFSEKLLSLISVYPYFDSHLTIECINLQYSSENVKIFLRVRQGPLRNRTTGCSAPVCRPSITIPIHAASLAAPARSKGSMSLHRAAASRSFRNIKPQINFARYHTGAVK